MKSKELAISGPVAARAQGDAAAIAPRWHTAALVALIVAVAATGSLLGANEANGDSAAPALRSGAARVFVVYAPLIAVEWGLLFYVCRVGRPRSALRALLGARATTLRQALIDMALAVEGWILVHAFEVAFAGLSGAHAPAAPSLLPATGTERLAWIAVSISAGFCEEVVYRGYLQRQLGALMRRPWLGVVLQAILFGVAHAEQGGGSAARLALYGAAFGALARWRRSLWPGILCHVAIDVTSGLLGR